MSIYSSKLTRRWPSALDSTTPGVRKDSKGDWTMRVRDLSTVSHGRSGLPTVCVKQCEAKELKRALI